MSTVYTHAYDCSFVLLLIHCYVTWCQKCEHGYHVPLQPPQPFCLDAPDEWPRWQRRFQQFRVASKLSKEDEERQVSTLLYCLGEQADDVLVSTNISEESRKKYDDILAKFDAHFRVRKNIIFERARFNRRIQEDESVDQFITNLYSLADNGEFGNMKDELIRDCLVVGIRDVTLSERLQTDEALTLEKAKKLARQREAVKEQQSILKHDETNLDYIRGKGSTPKVSDKQLKASQSSGSKCMRCGKARHSKQNCPVKDSKCYKCGKHGHFGTVYLSKTVAPVSEIPTEVDPIETSYLSAITDNNKPTKSWSVRVIVNGKVVPFVIDTGAEVSAISQEIYEVIGAPQLHRPKRVLCGPGRQTLDVRGCCTVKISHKHLNTIQTVYVIHNINNNLLGLPAIIALNILTQVNTVCSTDNQIIKKFPTLFQGLGTIKDELFFVSVPAKGF